MTERDEYTPTWFEIRERVEHDTYLTADEADAWLAEHDAKVRAEEREKPDREPSDAEVEAAAEAIIEASFGQELPEAPADLARAALLAARQVRRA